MKLAVYGKGGIGKSTTSCNISIALAKRGKKVLQIGCDPKHDSTFTLTGFLIPTIIDTLSAKDYHYEDIWPEDVIYGGYGGVDCVEAGGPPAGAGCGGYVVGETVKLLKELNAFFEYDIILFDVLGDVVCGGFAAPLNYADYCIIVTDNGFDALFAANRIAASVREKARTHPLRLAGLIGNRTSKRDLIDKYVFACPMPVLEVLPLIEEIRISRVKGKTLFEMSNDTKQNNSRRELTQNVIEPNNGFSNNTRGSTQEEFYQVGFENTVLTTPVGAAQLNMLEPSQNQSLSNTAKTNCNTAAKQLFPIGKKENDYICDFYLNIADQLLTEPEGVIPRELSDKELFTLLSDFYLKI